MTRAYPFLWKIICPTCGKRNGIISKNPNGGTITCENCGRFIIVDTEEGVK